MAEILGAIAAGAVIPVVALIGFLLFATAEGEPGTSRLQRVRAMWRHLWQEDASVTTRDQTGYVNAEAPLASVSGESTQRP